MTDLTTTPTYETKYAEESYSPDKFDINMSEGTGAWCLEKIVRNKDLMIARESIKGDRDAGKS